MRGWEFAGRYSPFENLWLTFNGAYTDARYIDYPDAPPPNDWLWTTNVATPLGVVSHPLTLSLSNTRFTGLPKWTFNLGANYERKVGKVLESVGGFWGEQNYTAYGWWNFAFFDTVQFTNPWSLIQYWQSPYTIVNAGVGLRTDDKRYALELWVKNLFDTRYIAPNGTWSQGTATAPASSTIQAQPRYFGLTFRAQLDGETFTGSKGGGTDLPNTKSPSPARQPPVDRHLCGPQSRLWLGRALWFERRPRRRSGRLQLPVFAAVRRGRRGRHRRHGRLHQWRRLCATGPLARL